MAQSNQSTNTTMPSAMYRVMVLRELLELILSLADPRDALRAQAVCQTWRDKIQLLAIRQLLLLSGRYNAVPEPDTRYVRNPLLTSNFPDIQSRCALLTAQGLLPRIDEPRFMVPGASWRNMLLCSPPATRLCWHVLLLPLLRQGDQRRRLLDNSHGPFLIADFEFPEGLRMGQLFSLLEAIGMLDSDSAGVFLQWPVQRVLPPPPPADSDSAANTDNRNWVRREVDQANEDGVLLLRSAPVRSPLRSRWTHEPWWHRVHGTVNYCSPCRMERLNTLGA